jgi:hypothetical protein
MLAPPRDQSVEIESPLKEAEMFTTSELSQLLQNRLTMIPILPCGMSPIYVLNRRRLKLRAISAVVLGFLRIARPRDSGVRISSMQNSRRPSMLFRYVQSNGTGGT